MQNVAEGGENRRLGKNFSMLIGNFGNFRGGRVVNLSKVRDGVIVPGHAENISRQAGIHNAVLNRRSVAKRPPAEEFKVVGALFRRRGEKFAESGVKEKAVVFKEVNFVLRKDCGGKKIVSGGFKENIRGGKFGKLCKLSAVRGDKVELSAAFDPLRLPLRNFRRVKPQTVYHFEHFKLRQKRRGGGFVPGLLFVSGKVCGNGGKAVDFAEAQTEHCQIPPRLKLFEHRGLRFDFVQMLIDVFHAVIAAYKVESGFFAYAGNAGNIVAGIPHKRLHLNKLNRSDAVFFHNGGLVHHFGNGGAHFSGGKANLGVWAYKLEAVPVPG